MGFFTIEHIIFQEQKGSISQAHLPQLSPADFDVSSAEQSRGCLRGQGTSTYPNKESNGTKDHQYFSST